MSRLLRLASLIAFVLCLLSGWLFYGSYLKWLSVFEDGRYFDPEAGVVFHENAFVWGLLSLAALLVSLFLWLVAGRIKSRESRLLEPDV